MVFNMIAGFHLLSGILGDEILDAMERIIRDMYPFSLVRDVLDFPFPVAAAQSKVAAPFSIFMLIIFIKKDHTGVYARSGRENL
jgi:hypothetical protein